jgi:hypothetical protein
VAAAPAGRILHLVRRILLGALLLLAAVLPAALAASPAAQAPGDAAIHRATALQRQWGRCPTARPAARVLAQAVATTKPVPRAKRARAALRAWREVARECATPVPMPGVTP